MEYNFKDAVKYHHGFFPPEAIDYGSFMEELLRATEALARFDQMLKNLHNSEILLSPLRNQEALLSSRIEGTISTMDEILEYEANHEGSDYENVKSDVIETILYQRTLKNTQQAISDGYEISSSLIKTMHQKLLSFGRGATKAPGAFKTEQNYLADKRKKEILFIPISPELLQDGMDRLFHFIKESPFPVLVRTAIMHLEFEALHPFLNGNGRIGRMLVTLNLWREKMLSDPHFYISGYFEEHKDAYIKSMRDVSRTGDWNPWIRFFLKAVEEQAIKNLQISESIRNLYEETKTSFSEFVSSKWNMEVLDFIFTHPVFRTNKFISTTKIPNATAANMIRKLVESDFLKVREEASGSRAAMYSFEPLMELVRV